LDELLPIILTGFAEHAALIKENRRAHEEQQLQLKEAEARRIQEQTFNARERRRMEFVDSINEQLAQRQKLAAVLDHINNAGGEHAGRMETMVAWLNRRIQQIDALISPLFLDISARFHKLDFAEVRVDPKWQEKGRYHSGRAELMLWKIDEKKGEASSRTELQWAIGAGLVPPFEAPQALTERG